MTKAHIPRGLTLVLAALVLTVTTGCERGKFGSEACDEGARVPVGSTAVLGVYYDINGQIVGTDGEDMFGTKDNKMCPAEPGAGGGGGCNPGMCPVSIPGRTFCVKCPS